MTAYYNEIDPFAAEWLRELIKAGNIAPGEVDTRSIADVSPDDLSGFIQCHFFAGIGVWSHALRQAGWADDRPVWTGSCPCQSFSAAGKGAGFDDPRHLWPHFYRLIAECKPDAIFGEQVEAAIRHGWLDLVQADLEREGYAVGSVVFPAAGIGAPHIRSRLYWVADSSVVGGRAGSTEQRGAISANIGGNGGLADAYNNGFDQGRGSVSASRDDGAFGNSPAIGLGNSKGDRREQRRTESGGPECIATASWSIGLADSISEGLEARVGGPGLQEEVGVFERHSDGSGLADTSSGQFSEQVRRQEKRDGATAVDAEDRHPCPTNGPWRDADWLFCRDGKWRPVEPGTFPLVTGASQRVGRLRGYGNAICAPQAQAFIEAYLTIK